MATPIATRSEPALSSSKAKARKRWEAADTIIAATVSLLVVVFAIFGFLVWQALDNTIPQASARAERAAVGLSERMGLVVGSAMALLDVVARGDGGPNAIPAGDVATLTEALTRLPAKITFGSYDEAGRSILRDPDLPFEISATSYFETLLQGREWVIDGLPGSDFVVGRRLSKDASFAGALVLRIDHSFLSSFWSLLDFKVGSTVSIIRDDGVVVARYPPLEAPLNLSGLPTLTALLAADGGSYVSDSSPADGIARIVGFQHVPNVGLIAVASLATEVARASIWTSTWIVLALLGPIGLALLFGSLATARVLRRSESRRRDLATAVAHNEVLFKEIHHRVKNNLQSVNSLLQLQSIPKEVRIEMGRRITAMSAVHEHIYRSNNFRTVDVKDFLQTLLRDIEVGQGAKIEISEHLEELSIDNDIATPLALIINEVLSNAFKHAFSDGRDGKLFLSLVQSDQGQGHLTIIDNGVGFNDERPTKGTGQRLIAALAEQVGGTATYTRDNGTRFDLTFPIAPQD